MCELPHRRPRPQENLCANTDNQCWVSLSTLRRTETQLICYLSREGTNIPCGSLFGCRAAITVFYTLGGANGGVAPVVVRATPKSTRTMTRDPSGTRTADSTDTE